MFFNKQILLDIAAWIGYWGMGFKYKEGFGYRLLGKIGNRK
jgi:hypothetical protein